LTKGELVQMIIDDNSSDLFPLKFSGIVGRPWQNDNDVSQLLKNFDNSTLGMLDPINLVKRAIPETLPLKITDIIPRLKDGGAFVKFTHPAEISATEIEGRSNRCRLLTLRLTMI
jgi:hypothetical protein